MVGYYEKPCLELGNRSLQASMGKVAASHLEPQLAANVSGNNQVRGEV
jgi:hypothetical protein